MENSGSKKGLSKSIRYFYGVGDMFFCADDQCIFLLSDILLYQCGYAEPGHSGAADLCQFNL